MIKNDYWRTVSLNLLFILLVPILLTFLIKESMILFLVYLLGYSAFESVLDAAHNDSINMSNIKLAKAFGITVAFNLLLLYGVSVIVEFFLFSGGLIVVFFLIVIWLLALSKVEVAIDNKLKKGRR